MAVRLVDTTLLRALIRMLRCGRAAATRRVKLKFRIAHHVLFLRLINSIVARYEQIHLEEFFMRVAEVPVHATELGPGNKRP